MYRIFSIKFKENLYVYIENKYVWGPQKNNEVLSIK